MKKLFCAVTLVGLMALPAAASAQLSVGPVAAFHDDFDFGVGGFVRVPVPSLDPNLAIVPSFAFFFPEDPLDFWEINGDVVYAFEVSEDTPVLPFAFAGLNIARVGVSGSVPGVGSFSSSSTEIGLNLGGGVTFRAESLEPFAGAKFEIQDGSGFVIFGGVGFAVGN